MSNLDKITEEIKAETDTEDLKESPSVEKEDTTQSEQR